MPYFKRLLNIEQETMKTTKEKAQPSLDFLISCGGRTRTCDLQVMSLASYQLLHSAISSKRLSLICECKGTINFPFLQILMHFFWIFQIKGLILHTQSPMCNIYVNIKNETIAGRCSTPVVRQERIGKHDDERHRDIVGKRQAHAIYLF